MTAGMISQPSGPGAAYIVSGSHTYADSGQTTGTGDIRLYTIQVFVVDDGGSKLTITNTANVADNSIPLTGSLNPASDSGLSTGTPDTTNVTQPNFTGTSKALRPSHYDHPAPQRDALHHRSGRGGQQRLLEHHLRPAAG